MEPTRHSRWAEQVEARVGALGVYATDAHLIAHQRTTSERVMRTFLTLLASWLLAPPAFLIPPHFEPMAVVLGAGVYMAWRAWRGEWVAEEMTGTCPRCGGALSLKQGSLLFLPHSLTCAACRSECWIELGAAPIVEADVRERARHELERPPAAGLGGRPPLTWSPASSDWRDRARD